MESPARELARRLGDNAEAVCRRYLSNGRREGHYWIVGNVRNAPGRSLYVRLSAGSDGGRAGKWTDAANGDHGDLLDIIAATAGHLHLRETLAEARHFLSLPEPSESERNPRPRKALQGTAAAARRLWAASKPIETDLASRYLQGRSLCSSSETALRFHPHCFYRRSKDDAENVRGAWPAMIAKVTDDDGSIHGVHRTWLDPDGQAKAPVAYPRRAMGDLLGHGVRFGPSGPVMAAGEGIETMLSIREAAPALPLIAGLSSAHLAAVRFPGLLRRLYVARENDASGRAAFASLAGRAGAAGIDLRPIDSRLDDLNSDLCSFGREGMIALLATQLDPEDAAIFLADS